MIHSWGIVLVAVLGFFLMCGQSYRENSLSSSQCGMVTQVDQEQCDAYAGHNDDHTCESADIEQAKSLQKTQRSYRYIPQHLEMRFVPAYGWYRVPKRFA